MSIEFLDITRSLGTWSVEVKAKVEGRAKFFDIRINLVDTTLKVAQVGVASNKNKDYKFLTSADNKYRYLTTTDRKIKFQEDIKNLIPKEVLIYALNKVHAEITIETDWILA